MKQGVSSPWREVMDVRRARTAPRGTPVGPSPAVAVVQGGGGWMLTVPEVAEELQVCRAVVYRVVARGELPATRVSNAIRVRREDLEAFVGRRGRP